MAKHYRKITAAMAIRTATATTNGNGRKKPGSQNRKKCGFVQSARPAEVLGRKLARKAA